MIFGGLSGILLIGGAGLGTVVLTAPTRARSKRDKRAESIAPRGSPGRMVRAAHAPPLVPGLPRVTPARPHEIPSQTTFDYSVADDVSDYADSKLGFVEPVFEEVDKATVVQPIRVVPYDYVEIPDGVVSDGQDAATLAAVLAAEDDEAEDEDASPFFSFSLSNGTIDAKIVAAGTLTWPVLTDMRGDHHDAGKRRAHVRRVVLADSECQHASSLLLAYRQDEAIREILLRSLSDFRYSKSCDIIMAALVDVRIFLRTLAARVAVETWQMPAIERALSADRTDVVLAAASCLVSVKTLTEVDALVNAFSTESVKLEVLRKLALLY